MNISVKNKFSWNSGIIAVYLVLLIHLIFVRRASQSNFQYKLREIFKLWKKKQVAISIFTCYRRAKAKKNFFLSSHTKNKKNEWIAQETKTQQVNCVLYFLWIPINIMFIQQRTRLRVDNFSMLSVFSNDDAYNTCIHIWWNYNINQGDRSCLLFLVLWVWEIDNFSTLIVNATLLLFVR